MSLWSSVVIEHESLSETLLDVIPSSVLLIDNELKITYANRNFITKSQRSERETIGHHINKAFPQIILEYTDIQNRILEVFRNQTPIKGHRMTYRAPGVPIRIYYYSILPIREKLVMLIMEDITEQVRLSNEVRRIERHLASVVESAHDIVLSTDVEGHILTWNTAAQKLSGLSDTEVTGQFFYHFFTFEFQRAMKDLLFHVANEKDSRTMEAELLTSSGDQVLVSWVISPMQGDYNQTLGFVVVGRDLTERRKLEKLLLQSQKLAALGVMAGGIAHEIRNPLAICYSAAQFLMDESTPIDLRRECSLKIQVGIKKASDIIENLLRFARPSPSNEMSEVDIVAVLHDTVDLISNQAKVQKIQIEMQLHDASLIVRGIPSLLQQVFMNIFLNAINAMPEGGQIKVTEHASEGWVLIQIKDTGIGIAQGDLDKIFDPFNSFNPKAKGTGLGLSISHTIVHQHLGTIEAESEIGQGTVLSVRLPIL